MTSSSRRLMPLDIDLSRSRPKFREVFFLSSDKCLRRIFPLQHQARGGSFGDIGVDGGLLIRALGDNTGDFWLLFGPFMRMHVLHYKGQSRISLATFSWHECSVRARRTL